MTLATSTAEAPASRVARKKLFYRIQEVSKLTGIKPYVLRYWETEFKELAPAKDASDQRRYRQHDIEVILAIRKLLYEDRFTIAGARKRLREEVRRVRGEEPQGRTERPVRLNRPPQPMVAEPSLMVSGDVYPVTGPCQIEMIVTQPPEDQEPLMPTAPRAMPARRAERNRSGRTAEEPRLGQVLRHLRADVDDLLRLLNA